MTDPLAVFFTQPFTVERYQGEGAEGPVLDAPVELRGRVKFASKLVRDDKGDEVVAAFARSISMAASTPVIPVGSRVTVRGHDRRQVVEESLHAGGFPGSPDYYSIDLE